MSSKGDERNTFLGEKFMKQIEDGKYKREVVHFLSVGSRYNHQQTIIFQCVNNNDNGCLYHMDHPHHHWTNIG